MIERIPEFAGNHPVLTLAFVVVLGLIIVNEIARRMRGFREVSPAEAVRIINQPEAKVLDLSTPAEYQEAHIAGAANVPFSQLAPDHPQISTLKGETVLAYCKNGQRSMAAGNRLKKYGIATLTVMKGGLVAWRGENLPVKKGRK